MRLVLILASLCLLTACGRPLTPAEKAFATQIHGDTLNVNRIRFHQADLLGSVTFKRERRPRLTCRERILPEPEEKIVTVSPAALALWNRVIYSRDWYAEDYLPDYPQEMSLVHAMLFAHEIVHVWQWQNRAQTGYTPWRAGREHRVSDDPYLFDIDTKSRFLDHGFEQQASIVEEYVCCATLDPDAPRTKRMKAMLSEAFPLGRLYIPRRVRLPWSEAKIDGICR
jgi:hypothetical protein